MSDFSELNEFDLELQKLKDQMKQLEEAREKKKKEIEISIPVKINIYEYRHYDRNFLFHVKPERDDVGAALRKIPAYFNSGRYNYSTNTNDPGFWNIHWDKMEQLKDVLSALPNVDKSI